MANSADPDQMLCTVVSDLGLHCLQRPILSVIWQSSQDVLSHQIWCSCLSSLNFDRFSDEYWVLVKNKKKRNNNKTAKILCDAFLWIYLLELWFNCPVNNNLVMMRHLSSGEKETEKKNRRDKKKDPNPKLALSIKGNNLPIKSQW